jgi:hypothetical protein
VFGTLYSHSFSLSVQYYTCFYTVSLWTEDDIALTSCVATSTVVNNEGHDVSRRLALVRLAKGKKFKVEGI